MGDLCRSYLTVLGYSSGIDPGISEKREETVTPIVSRHRPEPPIRCRSSLLVVAPACLAKAGGRVEQAHGSCDKDRPTRSATRRGSILYLLHGLILREVMILKFDGVSAFFVRTTPRVPPGFPPRKENHVRASCGC